MSACSCGRQILHPREQRRKIPVAAVPAHALLPGLRHGRRVRRGGRGRPPAGGRGRPPAVQAHVLQGGTRPGATPSGLGRCRRVGGAGGSATEERAEPCATSRPLTPGGHGGTGGARRACAVGGRNLRPPRRRGSRAGAVSARVEARGWQRLEPARPSLFHDAGRARAPREQPQRPEPCHGRGKPVRVRHRRPGCRIAVGDSVSDDRCRAACIRCRGWCVPHAPRGPPARDRQRPPPRRPRSRESAALRFARGS